MKKELLLCMLAAAIAGSACAGNRYRTYDESESADVVAPPAIPDGVEGSFAEIGRDDDWLFRPRDPSLGEISLGVDEHTEFWRGETRVDRSVVQVGMPVRVIWNPETNEIRRVELLEAG